MKRAALALALALGIPGRALAYRPFDQTDADVAKHGEIELEVGPGQLLTHEGERQFVPSFVFNYGLVPGIELVLDTQLFTPLAHPDASTFEAAPLVKLVLRRGVLQGGEGISVATEWGALLPELPHGDALGGSAALIASDRFGPVTVHANAYAALTPEHAHQLMLGAIVEGPEAWPVRPVGEGWVQRLGDSNDASILGGVLWELGEGLILDAAVRVAREEGQLAGELRVGFTTSFSVLSGEPEPEESRPASGGPR